MYFVTSVLFIVLFSFLSIINSQTFDKMNSEIINLPQDVVHLLKNIQSIEQKHSMKDDNPSKNKPYTMPKVDQTGSKKTNAKNMMHWKNTLDKSRREILEDSLMLKLVSFYEDKYNVSKRLPKVTTTTQKHNYLVAPITHGENEQSSHQIVEEVESI